ncbi:hypothetical protein KK137_12095 [Croceibacterium sp. LX-88]|uniref:Polysaccharide chain length determinant N-terminal domain-containing protein n=1 Tax=Croceibacterium selenioxidans TaxID=2838833 RepID=A0ABS5W5R3_9SPHN|nr:hypothetical protein [Croceibacterium selenioxidans]MBT2135071.1 hypothetical protein [Croceibacterium selenioxidans]
MSYWRKVSPRGAIEDLIDLWRQPTPYRWQILGVAVAMTFTMMVVFIPESQRVEPKRPHVTYITTFDPNRTDAEIVASNIENQKRQDKRRAELEALAERKKEAYKALGRATGIDVDAMEADIKREQAAEKAAADAAARAKSAVAQAPVEQ